MPDFPDSVFSQRTLANRVGQDYDPAKTTTIYAEDLTKLGDEITAIETFFADNTFVKDDDVTVSEFTVGPVDLGTGGYCAVQQCKTGPFIWTRIEITIGTSPSLGSLPLTINNSDLPIPLPTQPTGKAMPGSFGALTQVSNEMQMFAPAYNNISGIGEVILFFKEGGATFTDYLMGVNSVATLGAGDVYFGSMMSPLISIGSI